MSVIAALTLCPLCRSRHGRADVMSGYCRICYDKWAKFFKLQRPRRPCQACGRNVVHRYGMRRVCRVCRGCVS